MIMALLSVLSKLSVPLEETFAYHKNMNFEHIWINECHMKYTQTVALYFKKLTSWEQAAFQMPDTNMPLESKALEKWKLEVRKALKSLQTGLQQEKTYYNFVSLAKEILK